MGRRSDTDDSYELKKSKKKKKKRSRSRSRSVSSSGSSRYSSKHKKSKKFKSKHKKRSRSRSRERISRRPRSRSRSRDRRSRSRDKYSYSKRRSRSYSPRSRSRRSKSRSRGQRSSYERRSRTPEKKKDKSRKTSKSPPGKSNKRDTDIKNQIPGFEDMTPSEQAQIRMKLALKAAAAADEKIKEQLAQANQDKTISSFQDMTTFNNAVADIESASFKPAQFKSGRSQKVKTAKEDSPLVSHDLAIFGAGTIDIKQPVEKKPIYIEPDSYAHPNLYCDPEEKMQRWIQKLTTMRKKKLEGEAMLHYS